MSSERLSFQDRNWDDDLDNSLDNALNKASKSLFRYTDSSTRNNSLSSGIPLVSMGNDDRVQNDSSPLLSDTGFQYRNRSSGSLDRSRPFHKSAGNLLKRFLNTMSGERREWTTLNSIPTERVIRPLDDNVLGSRKYPHNTISNAKYNPITFIPVVLYEQFKFFFNLYFLLVALSQIVPQLRIGYLSSYVVPLAFVLTVTMLKEASDDIKRRRRDNEQNKEKYEVLNRDPRNLGQDAQFVEARDLHVGDVLRLQKGARVPADMIILQSSEKDNSGEAFLKTDQLDGETDWKLRSASSATQNVVTLTSLINDITVTVGAPIKSIHNFEGKLTYQPTTSLGSPLPDVSPQTVALNIESTMWATTVLASGPVIGMVIYTGSETRQRMNTSSNRAKVGLLEIEINTLSKVLCAVVLVLSVALVLAHGFPLKSTWLIDIFRFLILFSTIIPVSLRVNLDLAKSVYASKIQNDYDIPGTIVRTSTIPEDLGRIEYLLTDKTGTLTQNDMEMKKLHLGTVCYVGESFDIVSEYIKNYSNFTDNYKKKDLSTKVCDMVLTLALCHNVTPSYDNENDLSSVSYQAASPDEIAIVRFTESMGLKLYKRDKHSISLLHLATNKELKYEVYYDFPFSPETKKMGILVRDLQKEEIWFMQKGADTVMSRVVGVNDWLEEEVGNIAREGLRTLVIARKKLSKGQFENFKQDFTEASLAMQDRDAAKQRAINHHLGQDLDLLGLTGVEDKLQNDVKISIELLRNAGIKIWMLTGDKIETAKCVSISARLVSRGQYVHQISRLSHPDLALTQLEYLKSNQNSCLLIDGESLAIYMKHFRREFFDIVIKLPAVVACRCSPQQKADVALSIREFTGKNVCCIGDGGNDVSMIQSANVGVGVVGKEGKQASLAADFSVDQFCHLSKLLLWHGRNSYKCSAKLSQFIIHRGLLISVAQAVYSISSQFEPLALYQGFLMVGYSTIYTMAPVFSMTLDTDVDEHLTRLYPELYKELTFGKSLSFKTFFMWVLISLYQGCVIQILSQWFDTLAIENFTTMVALSFTGLVLNELFMVAISIIRWNKIMLGTIIVTFLVYVVSIPFLAEYFDLEYVSLPSFILQVAIVLALSLFPVWFVKYLDRKLRPPSYTKVQQD